MRPGLRIFLTSAVAIAGFAAAACSNAVGIDGPEGERLETLVSSSQVHVGDSITVTLQVTNPSLGGLTVIYGSSVTYAQVSQGNSTWAYIVDPAAPDTISLAALARTALRPVTLQITAPGVYPPIAPASGAVSLTPGRYDLAACAFVGPVVTPGGMADVPFCAQSVTLTVLP